MDLIKMVLFDGMHRPEDREMGGTLIQGAHAFLKIDLRPF